ncbi:hypothetical protein JWJ90_07960 [Desulfobulbus rhabdoformis]|uniref:hypothetical protein n=1 Tax=Desulfobulbus rhabdoformis TaxID=34032 RepID=UPI001963B7E4|nr:hypothetical protein [Desulfobulbus rhabdoformis]MBM9614223.1 hypothetical protein [Desulfobulbus rhabdoformis]
MPRIVGSERFIGREIPATHLFLLVVVAVSLVGFMLVAPGNWTSDLPALMGTVVIILVLLGFALNRVNPMGWKRIFKKNEYRQQLEGKHRVLEALKELDASYLVLCCFTFELLHIEFLIFGPTGIFVVGTTHARDPLEVENGILMAGSHSLHRKTGSLWRICHLLNLVIQKGYKEEFMPKPILITTHSEAASLEEFDSIAIRSPGELVQVIQAATDEPVPQELVRGMGNYVRERYLR